MTHQTEHLSPTVLNALADVELTEAQLAAANQHLAGCLICTSSALRQSLLKAATARAGQRYTPPAHLRERLTRLASQEGALSQEPSSRPIPRPAPGSSFYGWAAAFAVLLVAVGTFLVQRNAQAPKQEAALVTEVFDRHIAELASASPPQVISSDRHTVKPWFQGKLPFSFNIPENLQEDTTLDGANLTYLHDQPVAQLLYRIGKHRASVFLAQNAAGGLADQAATHSGFHILSLTTGDLQIIAVSDVDPARLSGLATLIEQAQTPTGTQAK